jgi:hypothetical protein
MQSFAVGMNYSDQTIEFIQEKLSDIKAEPKNAYRFPLIKIDNYFFVDAMVNNKPVRFCIDTGAHNSSISSQDLKVIGKPTAMLNGMQEISSAEDGKSFTGANARMLRFRNLTMGELKWKEPVFQNTISEQSTEISSLGNDFFRQFHVMIDFPMKTLYLTPDPAYKSPEQDWIGVGTEWYLNEGKVLIGRVYSPSPAQKAGLKIGDEVINLGGKVLKGLSYSEVTELFNARKKIGETVEMEILQKGSSSARKIKLQITKLL